MNIIPIIFSGPMVRALLEGRKTMTRRLAWKRKKCARCNGSCYVGDRPEVCENCTNGYVGRVPTPWQKVSPGDLLYVRETFVPCTRMHNDCKIKDAKYVTLPDGAQITRDGHVFPGLEKYADGAFDGIKWSPSIHMPRWASRLTLEVTATKIEPLMEISEDDARAEGVCPDAAFKGDWSYESLFFELWENLHGPKSFTANPEVVALTFKVHKRNVDTPSDSGARE